MKLYHNGEPQGWQIPGQQDRKAERVDVPGSPAELAAWLNERDVSPRWSASNELEQLEQLEDFTAGELEPIAPAKPRVPGFCDACGQSSAGKLKLSQGAEVETIIAWVERAELWQLERLSAAIKELQR